MDDYKAIARYENVIKKRTANSWNPDQERILKVWAEKASGWAWLHDQASRHYNSLTNRFTYPAIILSTISGGLGFSIAGNVNGGQSTSFIQVNKTLIYFISVFNITAAALSSLQKFIRSTEKAEMHMHMNKIFSSFSRKIILELALQPGDRRECIEFCKICRDEYDKLITDSPQIPAKVIALFKTQFPNATNIPEVANGLVHIDAYRSSLDGSTHNAFIAMRSFYNWKSRLPFRESETNTNNAIIRGKRISAPHKYENYEVYNDNNNRFSSSSMPVRQSTAEKQKSYNENNNNENNNNKNYEVYNNNENINNV